LRLLPLCAVDGSPVFLTPDFFFPPHLFLSVKAVFAHLLAPRCPPFLVTFFRGRFLRYPLFRTGAEVCLFFPVFRARRRVSVFVRTLVRLTQIPAHAGHFFQLECHPTRFFVFFLTAFFLTLVLPPFLFPVKPVCHRFLPRRRWLKLSVTLAPFPR